MHALYAFTNFLLVTLALALVFGIPVVILRGFNTREWKKRGRKQ